MLKKYLIYLSMALSIALSTFCNDININSKRHKICHFPLQLSELLKGDLATKRDNGGKIWTTIIKNDKQLVITFQNSFFQEIKKVLERTKIDLKQEDVTATTFTPPNNFNSDQSHPDNIITMPPTISNSIFYTIVKTTKPEDDHESFTIKCIEDLFHVFRFTAIIVNSCTEGARTFRYPHTYSNFKPFNCQTSNETGDIKFLLTEPHKPFKDWEKINRLRIVSPEPNIYRDQTENVSFTRGLFFQLYWILLHDSVYSKHDFYVRELITHPEAWNTPDINTTFQELVENNKFKTTTNNSQSESFRSTFYKHIPSIETVKKGAVITLSAAALTTTVYAALWYKGRGTSLPGMNRLFAPAFTKIATQTVDPALQKVASFFGKKVVDRNTEIGVQTALDGIATTAKTLVK